MWGHRETQTPNSSTSLVPAPPQKVPGGARRSHTHLHSRNCAHRFTSLPHGP